MEDSWERFVERLHERYRPLQAAAVARERLRRLRQTGTVSAYADVFQKELTPIKDMSAGDQIFNFVSGLSSGAVASRVREKDPKSLHEAMDIAVRAEVFLGASRHTSHGTSYGGNFARHAQASSSTGAAPMDVNALEDAGGASALDGDLHEGASSPSRRADGVHRGVDGAGERAGGAPRGGDAAAGTRGDDDGGWSAQRPRAGADGRGRRQAARGGTLLPLQAEGPPEARLHGFGVVVGRAVGEVVFSVGPAEKIPTSNRFSLLGHDDDLPRFRPRPRPIRLPAHHAPRLRACTTQGAPSHHHRTTKSRQR